MSELHAHIDRSQQDCDGPTYDSHVEIFNDDERAEAGKPFNDFSDLHFKERILGNAVSFHAEEAAVQISAGGFSYHEITDEGYRRVDVRWCEDDCDTNERSHRDVFAEQMGY